MAAQALAATLDAMGASESDLAWAVGLVHSRSFVLSTPNGGVSHVVAPGLDMANHSFEPTAFIRCAALLPSTERTNGHIHAPNMPHMILSA